MVRELSDYDYDRALRIADWPIREGLIALSHRIREQAREGYDQSSLLWTISAPYRKRGAQPPAIPRSLKDRTIDE